MHSLALDAASSKLRRLQLQPPPFRPAILRQSASDGCKWMYMCSVCSFSILLSAMKARYVGYVDSSESLAETQSQFCDRASSKPLSCDRFATSVPLESI